jgi:hypothetical protein
MTELHTDSSQLHLPSPSVWPATVALALTLLALGLVVHVLFGAAGVLLLVLGLWNWAGELRRG